MNDMRAILDYADEVSGEAILSGAREVRVYVPDQWTPEYVGFRMKEAQETHRKVPGGRIGPRGQSGFWPSIVHTIEDIRSWADDAKMEAERAKERIRLQPSAADLARMEEALCWPLCYLFDRPLEADAVNVGAYFAAFDIDPGPAFRKRRERVTTRPKPNIPSIAERIAIRMNAERDDRLKAEKRAVERWCSEQYRDRKIGKITNSKDRIKAINTIGKDGMARFDRIRKMDPRVIPNASLALPNKVIDEKALKTLRPKALAILAERLTMAGVPVR